MGRPYHLGVAYYPEHWDEAEWATDLRLMREAGIDFIRVAEFAWGRMEPKDGRFDFGWLDRLNALARSNGIKLLLCTPTEAPPPWLWRYHPDILPVDTRGLRMGANSRRHCCPNSKTFRIYSDRITRAMAEHFAGDDNVMGWQLDNEIGAHTHLLCTCDACQRHFRRWLQARYGDVATLNREWGLVFWSGEVNSFDEIVLHQNPITLSNPGYALDVQRFGSDSWLYLLHSQAEIIRAYAPGTPITHNVTWYAEQIEMFKLNEFLDVIGIDIYQQRPELVSMIDDMFYGIAKQPFWVMEMGVGAPLQPSGDGPRLPARLPVATAVKHILKGASATAFFRWRQSPSGGEMEGAGSLRRHDGSVTRVYEQLKATRPLLNALAESLPPPDARRFDAAIVLDYTDYLQIFSSPSKRNIDFFHDMLAWHQALSRYGLRCTFVHEHEDLSSYRLVIAHEKWSMDQTLAGHLRAYVEHGGILIAADRFGTHTRNCRMVLLPLPGHAQDIFGIRLVEYQEIRDVPGVAIRLSDELGGGALPVRRTIGLLEATTAEVLGRWDTGDLAEIPALSSRQLGSGRAIFVGALLEATEVALLVPRLLGYLGIEERRWTREALPAAAEIVAEGDIVGVFNHGGDPLALTPTRELRDLVGDGAIGYIAVPPYDVRLFRLSE